MFAIGASFSGVTVRIERGSLTASDGEVWVRLYGSLPDADKAVQGGGWREGQRFTLGMLTTALSEALDRPVVARDDAAELRAALRRCSNLIQDFLDFGIAPVDRGPARHAVEAARAALAATEGSEP